MKTCKSFCKGHSCYKANRDKQCDKCHRYVCSNCRVELFNVCLCIDCFTVSRLFNIFLDQELIFNEVDNTPNKSLNKNTINEVNKNVL